jgi:molecular chaperone Hsp33
MRAVVYGKAMSAMTFMSACLKEEAGEISLSVKSDGGMEEIGVSGNRKLNLRGYMLHTKSAHDKETEIEVFGQNGALTIIRDDGYNRPFVGSCGFAERGGVDAAFEEYFRISEQLPTRLATMVELDENGECVFAGVAVLQPLPFAAERILEQVKEADLNELLLEVKKQGVENCASAHFQKDEQVWELRKAQYQCNCSRDYLLGVLASLGEMQMRQIIAEDGNLKVHCHYCNTDYVFYDKDADELFQKRL